MNIKRLKFRLAAWLIRSDGDVHLYDRISHEIRTTLTSVVGYAEYVEMSSNEPLLNFTAKIIKESGEDLSSICDALLGVARLKSNIDQLYLKNINVNEFVDGLLLENIKIAQQKGIGLNVESSSTCEALRVDTIKLGKIITSVLHEYLFGKNKVEKITIRIEAPDRTTLLRIYIEVQMSGNVADIVMAYQNFWSQDCYIFQLQEGPGARAAFAKQLLASLNGTALFRCNSKGNSILIMDVPTP